MGDAPATGEIGATVVPVYQDPAILPHTDEEIVTWRRHDHPSYGQPRSVALPSPLLNGARIKESRTALVQARRTGPKLRLLRCRYISKTKHRITIQSGAQSGGHGNESALPAA
jgi:hypothetical protein